MTSGTFDVFIAYDSRDKSWTRDFARSLKHQGLSVWYSEEQVEPDSDLSKKVKEGLQGSSHFVSVVTEKSLEDPSTLIELGAALGMGKEIVLIASGDLKKEDLPPGLQDKVVITKTTPARTAAEVIRVELNQRR
jgi:hypothetical protein